MYSDCFDKMMGIIVVIIGALTIILLLGIISFFTYALITDGVAFFQQQQEEGAEIGQYRRLVGDAGDIQAGTGEDKSAANPFTEPARTEAGSRAVKAD